ncbi:hypothetical protein D3C73_1276760 [compost metagenome]
MRLFRVLNSSPTRMPSTSQSSNSGWGGISMNRKRRRSATSIAASERSAVFIVPMRCKLAGTAKSCLEYGKRADNASSIPCRLLGSMRVMSSPKMRAMFPRLISSMMRTYGRSLCCASMQSSRKTPFSTPYSSAPLAPARAFRPSTKSS